MWNDDKSVQQHSNAQVCGVNGVHLFGHMNPFGTYVPFCDRPLPLPWPLFASWLTHLWGGNIFLPTESVT